MSEHKIYFRRSRKNMGMPEARALVIKSIKTVLREEKVDVPCEVNVVLTDDEEIHSVNLEFRGVDRATDVLSFPAFEFVPGHFCASEDMLDPEGRLPLGDMMISLPRIEAQAEEYGHSRERELSYLAVHSTLHLLGYDHVDEGIMKREMRSREDYMMSVIGLDR